METRGLTSVGMSGSSMENVYCLGLKIKERCPGQHRLIRYKNGSRDQSPLVTVLLLEQGSCELGKIIILIGK